ncbi:MAG: histidine phosphatase family protein [Anaerolineales bacterium]|nr:histidine phosphatase family protein [Anaerolineales bacterium]
MKTLVLIRHAKSSWSEPGLKDHDRPLTKKGKKAARRVGAALVDWGIELDRMLTSTAVRTLSTAELIGEGIGFPLDEIIRDENLYQSAAGELLDIIQDQEDDLEGLMLIGHNPGMTDLVSRLSDLDLDNMPTSGVVVLQYDRERWSEIRRAAPVRVQYFNPRDESGS